MSLLLLLLRGRSVGEISELGCDQHPGHEETGAGGEDGPLVAGDGRVVDRQQGHAGDEVHGDAEPVGDGGADRLRDEPASEHAGGGEVEADGELQEEKGEEGHDLDDGGGVGAGGEGADTGGGGEERGGGEEGVLCGPLLGEEVRKVRRSEHDAHHEGREDETERGRGRA